MDTSNRAVPVFSAAIGVMLLALAVALTASCRGADQVAPDGFTITLAANPATIVLNNGQGSSDVVATVSSAVGVPQKDIDVRFSASAGSLFTPPPGNQPAANIPIRTDSLGNAHVLLITTTSTTVTAKSGTATGSLTLSTVAGNIASIILNQVQGAGCRIDSNFVTCSDLLCLEAQAVDTSSTPIPGVQVVFALTNINHSNSQTFTGVFNPGTTITTNASGKADVTFQLGSTCSSVCGGLQTCEGDLVVSLLGGGFTSAPVHFTSAIP